MKLSDPNKLTEAQIRHLENLQIITFLLELMRQISSRDIVKLYAMFNGSEIGNILNYMDKLPIDERNTMCALLSAILDSQFS